jgi:hypothetical protein
VSSILEALRELEGERPPAIRRAIPASEPPTSTAHRAVGAFIPVLGGLAIGVLGVAAYLWGPAVVKPTPRVETDAARPAAAAPRPAAAAHRPPAWLDDADAPRARVSRGPAAPAAAPAARTAVDTTAAEAPREHSEPRAPGGQVAVEAIRYTANAAERVATMRIGGRRVTLRQRESVDGVEVQLIMPNGVYLQRGSEVYLIPYTR